MPQEPVLTGWWVGWGIGGAVVLVVVVVVGTILAYAARIRRQAAGLVHVLHEIRDNTQPLWEVQQANVRLNALVGDLTDIRRSSGG